MRFNKQELAALASQTSHNFDREGVMVLKEKQDGFFRRSEGCSARWFRLRGNLLFYLKGHDPWHEPVGVIVLGLHKIKIQKQDENGCWPFHIVWDNGVSYRMATFHEQERILWLKSIEMSPFQVINVQIMELKEKVNRLRATTDICTYRLQKGIVLDMNEVPLCELALSCDNLLCDAYGRPPSPRTVIYVKYSKGLCIKYGTTEIVENCSNPSFSKTVLFRASDGLTRTATVRIVVYDVREKFSETAVPMGFTSMQLSTIQEAQRLRVPLFTSDNKTVGFVTVNGWSLEPSYIGTSPSHTNDKHCIDIPQKILCHRRSQSLPPKLGLKLKFPSYGSLLKQNFVNSHQVTYRFHSGLGGDITVHEIMAEPKLCYQMPMQLLEIYIAREKELLDELLSVGDLSSLWQGRQLELAGTHISLLKHYNHSKRCLHQTEHAYFKASSKKGDSSLEFAPINLHLQRMWVYNDTLNKTGFHDVITSGAFAAHTQKSEPPGGLIRLIQKVKDITSTKAALNYATANKIQAEYDNTSAMIRLRDEVVLCMERVVVLLQAKQITEIEHSVEVIKGKVKRMLSLWEPRVVEESLAVIGWPKRDHTNTDSQVAPAVHRITEQLNMFDHSDNDMFEVSSSSSSKETSPMIGNALFPSGSITSNSMIKGSKNDLQFFNDYFNSEERNRSNHSFRSVRSPTKPTLNDAYSLSFDSKRVRHDSLRHDFKSTASLEQVSYRCVIDSVGGVDKKKIAESEKNVASLQSIGQMDSATRENNLAFLKSVGSDVELAVTVVIDNVSKIVERYKEMSEEDLEQLKTVTDEFKMTTESLVRWIRISHAALRLRYEPPTWTKENAALQTRRDICFSQALATVTAGLLCWFCSVPSELVLKVLTSDLGPLCTFEGLLSLISLEKSLWGDMVVAVEDLQTVVFSLTKVGHSNMAIPQVTGSRGAITVYIPVSDTLYNKVAKTQRSNFTITAVFFNIGINEKATLADALGETIPQFHSNNDNLDRLYKYYHKYNKIFPADPMASSRGSSRTKPLEEVMENLRIAVHKKVTKNVEVLHLAALATRLMNGIRFTSCKSAKDRTGMSVTLEQCSILASEYHLDVREMKKALSIMRSEGCRRENTYKNVGVRKYAFSKKQVTSLPIDYRPPPGTYGSSQT